MSMFQREKEKEVVVFPSAEGSESADTVETVVGPSVRVEGDFASQGNVVIEGMVMGNVKTEKNLRVEENAKIHANVSAENARIAGEVRGNMRIAETLELTPTARVYGDIEAKILSVAPGAILHGRCIMADEKEDRPARTSKTKKVDSGLEALVKEMRGEATIVNE